MIRTIEEVWYFIQVMEYAGRERCFHVALAAAAIAFFTLTYSFLYWNRFLAPSSGATSFYAAELMLRGQVPYRDFLFLTPPLHALKIAALISVFGDRLAVPRMEALIERTILSVVLFVWLSRCYRISAAFLGAMAAMVIFAGDIADSLADYHHDSVFWAVAAGFCASLFLSRPNPSTVLAAASGLFAGFCFLTKQTTGAGVLVAIPALIAALKLREHDTPGLVRFGIAYLLGWAAPVSALLFWLYREHALSPFWNAVFVYGGSKGSLWTLLTRPFLQMPIQIVLGLLASVSIGAFLPHGGASQQPESRVRTAIVAGSAAVLLATGFWTARSPRTPEFLKYFIPFHWFIIVLAFLSCGLIFLSLSRELLRSKASAIQRDQWFFSGLAFAIAYMLALSWPAYSPMVVPSLALAVAFGMDRLETSALRGRYAVAAVCICLVTYIHVTDKLTIPFGWMFWQEGPVVAATHESTLPQLQGLALSEPTLSIAETVTSIIRNNSQPGDTILVYPYFPIFYVLSKRDAPTYSFNHFLDVCPDAVCASDAARILSSRPAVIVYMVESAPILSVLENAYRGGRRSGSRDVVTAVEQLAKSYRLLYSFATPGFLRQVNVYGRK